MEGPSTTLHSQEESLQWVICGPKMFKTLGAISTFAITIIQTCVTKSQVGHLCYKRCQEFSVHGTML